MPIYPDITALVGKTPLVRLNKITENCVATVTAKLEFFNPASSIKDRVGLAMINAAEKAGKIKKDITLIESTSGNTGIALAWVCAVRGYKLILTMPESMTIERRKFLKALGAQLVLTPASLGIKGAIAEAQKLNQEIKNSLILSQFDNSANPAIHRKTTGPEIWKDTEGKVDIFVAGVGTGGTITGVGEYLKKKNPKIQIVAVEPASSPVLSGGNPGPHMIQGIGAGFIPKNLNTKIYNEVIKVKNEDAIKTMRELGYKEGIFAGISSGANLWATLEIGKRKENSKKLIVTVFSDTGERYLSTALFEAE